MTDLIPAGRRPIFSLILFFTLAFAITWLAWGSAALISPDAARLDLMILGGLGPLAAAVIASAVESGRGGVVALFRRLAVRLSWRVMALLLLAIAALRLAPLLLVLTGQPLVPLGMDALAALPVTFLFVALVGGGLDEEAGWRGFAQPRLQKLVPPLPASVLIGLVWSLWHLPLWFLPGSVHGQLSLPVYVLSTTALSVLLAYAFNVPGGSLLAVVLVHAASNTADNLRYALAGVQTDASPMLPLQLALGLTMVTAAVVLIAATRGRLGLR
jgi:CAAX amino terminal protease family.